MLVSDNFPFEDSQKGEESKIAFNTVEERKKTIVVKITEPGGSKLVVYTRICRSKHGEIANWGAEDLKELPVDDANLNTETTTNKKNDNNNIELKDDDY
eukprot:g1464.t1